jgi:NAD+ synthase
MEKVKEQIIDWLKDQLNKSGLQGYVVGLSGGIDSSVVAALAKKTEHKILGLIMPCESFSQDEEHAVKFAEKFSIPYKKIDLTEVYRKFLELLPKSDQMIRANLKSRLRMNTLYYNAGVEKSLVLGTGNKTELKIGYFTKYGDGASDLLPIADLYKKDVFKIAELLDVNKEIINKPPSAGLWENQTDEKEMGISYKELDDILIGLEEKKGLSSLNQKLVDKVKKMIVMSEHKRSGMSICYIQK